MVGRAGTLGEVGQRRGETRSFVELDDLERAAHIDQLAAEAAGGDAAALDDLLTLIDAHRLARGAIRRLIVDDADADDVAQDVLIKVAAGIGGFRGESRFTTWLHAVARNCAIGHLRRTRDDVALRDEEMSPAQRVSSLIATRGDLRAAIDRLPEHYRDVVVLRDVDGLAYAAIADRLTIEVGTVRSRLARGRALVARSLDSV